MFYEWFGPILIASIFENCKLWFTSEMSGSLTPTSNIIRLNIGGLTYTTTRSTLTSRGENFFTGLFGGRFPAEKDEHGAYFIDRNGRYFQPLLDYLRTGKLIISKDLNKELVLEEAKFFCIKLPQDSREETWDTCSLEIVYNDKGFVETEGGRFLLPVRGYQLTLRTRTQSMVVVPPSNDNWRVVCQKMSEMLVQMAEEGWDLFLRTNKELLPNVNLVYTIVFRKRGSLSNSLYSKSDL
eukprot:TRINITY_DN4683_c0_g1_i1.p1 TRINITY_DN4683_c0_g1~~TRINITY_DN4683_c0_g1_i1.p1  ORF type:complete len:239 (-),score=13.26 TRINITY_DN4683_c0_g1_i1:65-781(-)